MHTTTLRERNSKQVNGEMEFCHVHSIMDGLEGQVWAAQFGVVGQKGVIGSLFPGRIPFLVCNGAAGCYFRIVGQPPWAPSAFASTAVQTRPEYL